MKKCKAGAYTNCKHVTNGIFCKLPSDCTCVAQEDESKAMWDQKVELIKLLRTYGGSLYATLSDEYLSKFIDDGRAFEGVLKMFENGARYVGEENVVISREEYAQLKSLAKEDDVTQKLADERALAYRKVFEELNKYLKVDAIHSHMQNNYTLSFENYSRLAEKFHIQ